MASKNVLLNIIHFNDVYNITESDNDECCGGAARFKTIVDRLKALRPEPLMFFSGDFLNPSQLSTVTNGEHMIPVMNSFGISCSMIGNHDLDFGNEHAIQCLAALNFPTLCSNLFTPKRPDYAPSGGDDDDDDAELEPLGRCLKELVIEHNGLSVGVVGVAEDWTNTIPLVPAHGIVYRDFVAAAAKRVAALRAAHPLDVVVALTHSRRENDLFLAERVEGIDVILGGHDHLYHVGLTNECLVVKSGCDFQGVTLLRVEARDAAKEQPLEPMLTELNAQCLAQSQRALVGRKHRFSTFHYIVSRSLAPDPGMAALVESLSADFMATISKPIGRVFCDLDTRFVEIRRKESAACNLVCDVVRNAYRCDAVILCGGGIRSDTVHKNGELQYRHILDMVPFQDPVIVRKVAGRRILSALSHSVLNLPKLDGRFAHVSGLKYEYDSSAPPRDRLVSAQINEYGDEEKGEPKWTDIDPDRRYTVASREYTMNGGDGFEMLHDAANETVVGEDGGHPLCVVLRNFFWAISAVNDAVRMLTADEGAVDCHFRDDLNALIKGLGIAPESDAKHDDDDDEQSDHSGASKDSLKENHDANVPEMKGHDDDDDDDEDSRCDPDPLDLFLKICPVIEGRIVDIAHEADDDGFECSSSAAKDIEAFCPSKWHKLPPWLHLVEKPSGIKALAAFVRFAANDRVRPISTMTNI